MAVSAAILFQKVRKQEVIVLTVLDRVFVGHVLAYMRKKEMAMEMCVAMEPRIFEMRQIMEGKRKKVS